MNEVVIREIEFKVNDLRKHYDEENMSAKKYVTNKVKLYKVYMDYPEEFSKALTLCGCYLLKMTDGSCPNPFITCEQCKRTVTHDLLLKQINHVP